MNRSRSERIKPCPVRGDQPLTMPDVVECHCFVMRVYYKWSTKTWTATVARDAIQLFETEPKQTKKEAEELAIEKLKL